MIQFNLLPDIKLEYIRARRIKRLVITISAAVSAGALALCILFAVAVLVFQRGHMNNLSRDIDIMSTDLKGTQDLGKILTIQNQLNTVPGIHEQKPAATRLIPFIKKVTPSDVYVSSVNVEFEVKQIVISGTAADLVNVNKYVDTLKFTKYVAGEQSANAFSGVTLTGFSKDQKGANYTIQLQFDPLIWDNTKNVDLQVPAQTTTRSVIEKPGLLFNEQPKETKVQE